MDLDRPRESLDLVTPTILERQAAVVGQAERDR